MPNQRASNKKSLSFWIPDHVKARLDAFCIEHGMTKSDAVQQMLESMLDELESQDSQTEKGGKSKAKAKR